MKNPLPLVSLLPATLRRWQRALTCCVLVTLISAWGGNASAQVPDLTTGGVPTDDIYWNLGPTGMKGWFYHLKSSTASSRQIKVITVDATSPADGALQVTARNLLFAGGS